jgi:hypothetical protein
MNGAISQRQVMRGVSIDPIHRSPANDQPKHMAKKWPAERAI